MAPDTTQSRDKLARALEDIHYATAALDPKTDRVPLALVWREEAMILGDLGLLAMRAGPLVRADSLLEAAAAVFPSGKYPAQASVVCYEKGRLARLHWQLAAAAVDPKRGAAAGGTVEDGGGPGAEAFRSRALREFRDAAEIMPAAQNPALHRRIREELAFLGATESL